MPVIAWNSAEEAPEPGSWSLEEAADMGREMVIVHCEGVITHHEEEP
jgi:hypothetical protein